MALDISWWLVAQRPNGFRNHARVAPSLYSFWGLQTKSLAQPIMMFSFYWRFNILQLTLIPAESRLFTSQVVGSENFSTWTVRTLLLPRSPPTRLGGFSLIFRQTQGAQALRMVGPWVLFCLPFWWVTLWNIHHIGWKARRSLVLEKTLVNLTRYYISVITYIYIYHHNYSIVLYGLISLNILFWCIECLMFGLSHLQARPRPDRWGATMWLVYRRY